MTRPRSELIDRENGGIYHVGGRCVRRAMLCGEDPVSGLDLSHRRGWIVDLALHFAEIFTVHVVEFAVMSNHYHLVVLYQPKDRLELGDEDVARRWLRLFPPRDTAQLEAAVAGLLDDPDRLAVLRGRLGDLSWYMARLNETVARMANAEDGCTGRFWQGRFASKDLPDERSVWACMAYDALNPVRAGIADGVEDADHTGLQARLQEAEAEPERLDEPLAPAGGPRRPRRQRPAAGADPRHHPARVPRARRVDRRAAPRRHGGGARAAAARRPQVVAQAGGVVPPARRQAVRAPLGPRLRLRHPVSPASTASAAARPCRNAARRPRPPRPQLPARSGPPSAKSPVHANVGARNPRWVS